MASAAERRTTIEGGIDDPGKRAQSIEQLGVK
jgi:hypothetical protein